MKRAMVSGDVEDAPEPKKKKVMYSTYQKWRHNFDRNCRTITWLGARDGKGEAQGYKCFKALFVQSARRASWGEGTI